MGPDQTVVPLIAIAMRHEIVGGKEALQELHGSSPASEASAKHLEENLVRRWDRLLKAPVDCNNSLENPEEAESIGKGPETLSCCTYLAIEMDNSPVNGAPSRAPGEYSNKHRDGGNKLSTCPLL